MAKETHLTNKSGEINDALFELGTAQTVFHSLTEQGSDLTILDWTTSVDPQIRALAVKITLDSMIKAIKQGKKIGTAVDSLDMYESSDPDIRQVFQDATASVVRQEINELDSHINDLENRRNGIQTTPEKHSHEVADPARPQNSISKPIVIFHQIGAKNENAAVRPEVEYRKVLSSLNNLEIDPNTPLRKINWLLISMNVPPLTPEVIARFNIGKRVNGQITLSPEDIAYYVACKRGGVNPEEVKREDFLPVKKRRDSLEQNHNGHARKEKRIPDPRQTPVQEQTLFSQDMNREIVVEETVGQKLHRKRDTTRERHFRGH